MTKFWPDWANESEQQKLNNRLSTHFMILKIVPQLPNISM